MLDPVDEAALKVRLFCVLSPSEVELGLGVWLGVRSLKGEEEGERWKGPRNERGDAEEVGRATLVEPGGWIGGGAGNPLPIHTL